MLTANSIKQKTMAHNGALRIEEAANLVKATIIALTFTAL